MPLVVQIMTPVLLITAFVYSGPAIEELIEVYGKAVVKYSSLPTRETPKRSSEKRFFGISQLLSSSVFFTSNVRTGPGHVVVWAEHLIAQDRSSKEP